jgi:parallel beta-helix repeat protein
MVARAMVLALLAAGFAVLGAGQALAGHVSCGDTITTSTTLHRDLVNCPSNGIVIGADNITLDLNGHTIDGHTRVTVKGGSVRQFGEGVLLLSASHNRLRHLAVSGNFLRGILVVGSSNTRIEGSSITRNGLTTDQAGLVLFTSHHNRIEGNRVSANGDIGLFTVDDTNGNRIANNTFSDNPEAAILMGGNGNRLTGNRLLRNGDGIGIGIGIGIAGNHNTITRNLVADAQVCPEECGIGLGISIDGVRRTSWRRTWLPEPSSASASKPSRARQPTTWSAPTSCVPSLSTASGSASNRAPSPTRSWTATWPLAPATTASTWTARQRR